MNEDFIPFEPVLETHNAGDQAFLKSLLDAAGIAYFFQGEHVAPYVFHALPMRLMVRRDQVAAAKTILKDVTLSFSYGQRGSHPDKG